MQPATPQPPTVQPPTVQETRAEFEAVCQRARSGDDPYFGTARAEQLEARLERLDALGEPDPVLVARTAGALGLELLRLGEVERGQALLSRARRLAEEAASPALPPADARFADAIGQLVLAESRNCVEGPAAAACILPLAPEAVHRRPEAAREAARLLDAVLAERPDDPQARWLANVAHQVAGDPAEAIPEAHRLAPWPEPRRPFPRWENVAGPLGVASFDWAGGVAIDDFDGDGLLDIVTSSWHPCEPMKAFRNDGTGGFETVTAEWGLDGQLGGLNLVSGDYDGDGRLDLLVLRGAWRGQRGRVRNSLLRNELPHPNENAPRGARQFGDDAHRFVDRTAEAGLAWPAYPTQTAAWADFDGDGDLDLYVGNEATGENPSLADFARLDPGRPFPSQLFRNDGDGTFTDVAGAAGVANLAYAKGVAWGDFDDDGDPDLYVSNLGGNRLYRNDGDGTFSDIAPRLGLTGPDASFATWWFDPDNDGDLDLFVADYGTPVAQVVATYLEPPGERKSGAPVLYENLGVVESRHGGFRDASAAWGLTRPALPMGANHGDLDNDGWQDLYLGTGVPNPSALMPNVMLRNVAGGEFEDVTFAGGFGHLQKGHAVAFADLDNDGDQDLFEQMGGAYPYDAYWNVLYENPTSGSVPGGSAPSWITLRLEGAGANRFAVGARITVETGERTIHRLVGSGGSFGAGSLQEEIGLGELPPGETIRQIVVLWPSGRRQTFADVAPDRIVRLVEGEPEPIAVELPRLRFDTSARPTDHHDHPGAPSAPVSAPSDQGSQP
jgi:hypothetical protein